MMERRENLVQREEDSGVGVGHTDQHGSDLRPGDGGIGPEGAGVVIARENPCPGRVDRSFVGLVHVGNGAVGYVVDRGESGAGKGLARMEAKSCRVSGAFISLGREEMIPWLMA